MNDATTQPTDIAAAVKRFDLSDADSAKAMEDGEMMQVRHPTSKATIDGMTITLAGIDSERFKKAQRGTINRRLKVGGRRGGQGTVTAEEIETDTVDNLAAATIGWSGIVLDGKDIEFSVKAAQLIYRRFDWLKEQVEDFVADRANFLKASPKL